MAQVNTAFNYRARNAAGRIVKGKVDAPNYASVVTRVRGMGLTPLSIDEVRSSGLNMELNIKGFEKSVKLKDIALMSRQLATMIGAGVPLIRALNISLDQIENDRLRRVMGEVRSDVETGSSLSDALARRPKDFPPLMINMVRAGETGGFLDESLESIATNYEKEVALRGKIKSAMTYPVVVLCISVVAVIAMLIFIVPVFETMFADFGSELPIPTQILVGLSRAMPFVLPVLVVGAVVFTIWWQGNKNNDAVRNFVDPLKFRLPVFGPLLQKISIARFTRNFSTMMASGVPLMQTLAIVGETSGNEVVQDAAAAVQDAVRQGRSLAGPMAAQSVFPPMVSQMVAVGEDSGSLESMLGKVADFYDAEVESTTEQLTSLIEPLLIVFLGVVVGGMVISLYLPIFSLMDVVGAQ